MKRLRQSEKDWEVPYLGDGVSSIRLTAGRRVFEKSLIVGRDHGEGSLLGLRVEPIPAELRHTGYNTPRQHTKRGNAMKHGTLLLVLGVLFLTTALVGLGCSEQQPANTPQIPATSTTHTSLATATSPTVPVTEQGRPSQAPHRLHPPSRAGRRRPPWQMCQKRSRSVSRRPVQPQTRRSPAGSTATWSSPPGNSGRDRPGASRSPCSTGTSPPRASSAFPCTPGSARPRPHRG